MDTPCTHPSLVIWQRQNVYRRFPTRVATAEERARLAASGRFDLDEQPLYVRDTEAEDEDLGDVTERLVLCAECDAEIEGDPEFVDEDEAWVIA